ncbi:protein unc-13 homolog [Corylus avellana]|uniref:protein unc-13 homolog n=1 Tax=Corylus avellana TaxID=13451 RepID=UPI00286D52CE|nr:protein unc-13 homolog [Corylus avellana]
MEQQPWRLLQRYRGDRRKLLEFLLSSGLITELRTPAGPIAALSDVDLDKLSADYVLHCIKYGGVLDVSEATKKYFDESSYPVMIHSQLGNSYFLLSDPDLSGSPPTRVPPSTDVNLATNHASFSSSPDPLIVEDAEASGEDFSPKHEVETCTPLKPMEDVQIPPLGLPCLNAGLSDDDLRESAYEILLASLAFSGVEVHTVEDRRKEKSAKLLSGLKSRRDKIHQQSESRGRQSELIETIRIQMQISEPMDACIRQRLMQLTARRMWGSIDIPQMSLGLLASIFKSDFLNGKSYMQWKSRQASILEELLYFSTDLEASERLTIQSSLANIRNSKEWDMTRSPSERAEILSALTLVALKLSSLSGKFNIQGETYYWTADYHLNVRLYEKLLFGVFDVLDEGQLIMESNELLMLIKLTWPTLGITQKMHNALYGWVLFQQYVGTDEAVLLEYALLELQKVLSAENDNQKEEHYMDSLACSRACNGSEIKLCLVQAIFFSISSWCDSKLQDYHLHFSQKPHNFSRMMNLLSAAGILTSGDFGDIELIRLNVSNENATRKLMTYVERSIKASYRRVASTLDLESKVVRQHPLALLANELKLIAQREFSVFCPVLRRWCPESGMIAAMRLHQIYGERLKPFLKGVSSLSEDVRSVLSAAHSLDHDLTELYISACEDNRLHHHLNRDLDHYPIGEVAKPIILDWVIAQNSRILEWTGRVFDLEDWEPLSSQQRHAASAVEVFRIIEETVDQFFGLNLSVDITHLQALLSVIFHSLDAYLVKLVNQLVEKNHLHPMAPPLTRYEETVIPIMKKKVLEHKLLEDDVRNKLNELTISKLCVRLNTLKYIQKQIDILEDGTRKSWALIRPPVGHGWAKEVSLESSESSRLTCSEAVDELFVTTFSSIRDTTTDAISKIHDFAGARVVFWDLRDAFLFRLYRGNVEGARLDSVLPHIDKVLDHICGLIDDTLRDLVVFSVCRALLEGYVWVLLNGGPSRAFSNSDITIMEDDLNMLKEFFIADGEGLPRSLVEQEAKLAEQILSLYTLQTGTVIQMLMTASEQISTGLYPRKDDKIGLEDAQTLIRIMCHKKDRQASKFLKRLYQLPTSSEYDDTPSEDSTLRSPLISDLLKRSSSFHWTNNGPSSFKSFKKKLQEATSDIRNMAW